jgi:protein tyrosine phosphatase
MVWQTQSHIIVMLTKVFDFIRVMCAQYWPSSINKTEQYGHFQVTLLDEEKFADYVIRTVKLRYRCCVRKQKILIFM